MASAGVAVGVANFLAGAPNNAKTWNTIYHDVVDFLKKVEQARSDLQDCIDDFVEWQKLWKYNSVEWNSYASLFRRSPDDGAPAHNQAATQEPVNISAQSATGADTDDHSLYKSLWGDQYDRIQSSVHQVVHGMRCIDEHIDRIVNEKKNCPAWKKYLDVPRARYIRNITFALFSNSDLRDEIARLKLDIGILKRVSERRLRKMRDDAADLNLTGREAFHLANLEYFGRKIVRQLPAALPTASAWSLELCHPGISGIATSWQNLPSVKLWLSYSMPVVGQNDDRQRIVLKYDLFEDPNPPQWASSLPGANTVPNLPANHARELPTNPILTQNSYKTGKVTVPLSKLFRTWYGDEFFQADLWARDQAYLVLSLANWSLLLWTSDWTARWCSSGLQFVQAETHVETAGRNAFFFPSFSRCALEEPGTAVNQGQHQHRDCFHSDLKLRNLGLVLAEAICIIPLRVSNTNREPYEKYVNGEWKPVSEIALLDLVDKQTASSESVRDAVQYCLESNDTFESTKDKLAYFFGNYVKTVFDP